MKKTKQHKKIKILFTCCIILVIILNSSVKAGIQDSLLKKNRIEGIYAIAPLSDKTHLFYLQQYTLNENVAYCIELGKDITTEVYNSTTDQQEQERITNLNSEQLEYIKTIAYFGYGYKEHNKKEYYMAAQELIWEYLMNIDITWTNELNINGQKINIEAYKNEINNLAEKYLAPLTLPKNVTYKINSTNILTEENNNLNFYNASSKKNQQVNILENQLEIKIGPKYILSDTITLTRKNDYNTPATIYNFENSQNMLSAGNIQKKEYNIQITITGADLRISVVDKDNKKYIPSGQASLIDPIYELYNSEKKLITTFKIPYPGFLHIANLSLGTYYIKHKQPSKGYQLEPNFFTIEIDKIANEIILLEEVIKSNIEINKLYEFKNNNIREPNITFEIYDNNNNLYQSITTTEKGPDIITLPFGEYIIKQKNTTYGYQKVEDINLNIDENSNINIKYNLLDKQIKSLVHIKTLEENSNKKIQDNTIKYKIKNKTDNNYITYINELNKITEVFLTNEEGEITLPIKLPYGEYILEQVSPPKKYIENNEKITFIINENTNYSYIDDEIVTNIDFYNKPIIGILNIKTTEEKTIVKDNTFKTELVPKENQEIELYNNNKLIRVLKTNEEGILKIKDLSLGTYCIKNKETLEEKCVELINKDNKTEMVEENIVLIQKEEKGNLIIKNIDEEYNPISGTIFEIIKEEKNIGNIITNEEGIAILKDLPKGKYCLNEKKINKDYLLNNKKECFTIEVKKEKTIIVTNKKNIKPNNPSTHDNIHYFFYMLIFSIITIIILKTKIKSF